MSRSDRINHDINQYVIKLVAANASNLVAKAAKHFGVSRVTIGRYLNRLVQDGAMIATGTTRKQYQLVEQVDQKFDLTVSKDMHEDRIWRENVLPLLESVSANIINICHYGVTEMINNVIDHSESTLLTVNVKRNAKRIELDIIDKGAGIFEKIQRECHLHDPRHALLELSKGKLTTDPRHHSGEGIFFTSRMFTEFSILSGELFYSREMQEDDEWLIEVKDSSESVKGTVIKLSIDLDTSYTIKDIFDKYTDDDFRFSRTHVPVRLAKYGNEQLVSRSQAKRVLARFENFTEVILDFNGVQQIGQGFADEIFRVFKNEHPEVNVYVVNTTKQVEEMIKHVKVP